MNFLPLARTTDILIEEAGRKLLLYDLQVNQAYFLNETSALIYQHCNGRTTIDDMKLKYRNLTDELILSALDGLSHKNLLNENVEVSLPLSR